MCDVAVGLVSNWNYVVLLWGNNDVLVFNCSDDYRLKGSRAATKLVLSIRKYVKVNRRYIYVLKCHATPPNPTISPKIAKSSQLVGPTVITVTSNHLSFHFHRTIPSNQICRWWCKQNKSVNFSFIQTFIFFASVSVPFNHHHHVYFNSIK